jgi:Tfp pilus assembly protein PilX
VTVVVTLVLLVVMLLGGIAIARMTEVGTLAAGNSAYHEAAVQASEVGVNTAYAAVKGLVDEEANSGNWYFAQSQAVDAAGLPAVNWGSAPEIVVGNYSIRYVVDRLCSGTLPIADVVRQCLNKSVTQGESAVFGAERPDPASAKQFRVTVRVTGPKGTQTWVQSLITRG